MKWSKAVKIIEDAIARDDYVAVSYHRKWMTQEFRLYDPVESVSPYDWHGEECKGITTASDILTEGTHIIDEVLVDSFFYTHSGNAKN